jgi:hypothetical protein
MRNIFKDKLILILTVVIVVLFAAVVFLLFGGQGVLVKNRQNIPESLVQSQEAAKETKKLIDEAKKSAEKVVDGEAPLAQVVKITRNDLGTTTVEEEAVIVAPGASPVSVETGEVINTEGKVAENDATGGSRLAPSESYPVDPKKLLAGTILIQVTPTSIVPAEFRVKAGQVVSLAASASQESMEILRFEASALSAVVVGLENGQTRAITFSAPFEKGEYVFYSDFKNHKTSGATGKMIVE